MDTILQRAFAGGELSPSYGARADLGKYVHGATTVRNFLVRKAGGLSHRPGTRFVAEVKDSSSPVRLFKFIFEADDQTYLIEAGEEYFRFYHDGGRVMDGMSIYEVATPYAAADLAELRGNAQSADVITFTHPNYPPYELRRNGETDWDMVEVEFGASIAAPTGGAGTPGAAGAFTYRYVVTAAKAETLEQSLASAVITVASAAVPTVAAPIELTWNAQGDAEEYYVYKDEFDNGIFGFIGAATSNSFKDPGFAPDYGDTPPVAVDVFGSSGNYPRISGWYQQRRWFGGTDNERETLWGSQTGAFANFNKSTPLQPTDGLKFVLASKHINPPVDIIGLREWLGILTDGGEWVIQGDQGGDIVPTAINADQVGYRGSDGRVPAIVIGQTIVHLQALGTTLRALRMWQRDGDNVALSIDLTTFARHLFDGHRIVSLDYAQDPESIVWAVRDDGVLLGLTYDVEADLFGWHRHDTAADGLFEEVCVIPDREVGEDRVYVVVNRTIDGSTVRYIEEFAPRHFEDLEDAWLVDAGIEYSGVAATVMSGLDHLEGEEVVVFADGAMIETAQGEAETFTVSGGAITLPSAVTRAVVGLAVDVEFQSLDLDLQGSNLREKRKCVKLVTAHVDRTVPAFSVGSDASHLRKALANEWDGSGLFNGPITVKIASQWEERGRVIVQQSAPVPLTILGLAPHVEVGS